MDVAPLVFKCRLSSPGGNPPSQSLHWGLCVKQEGRQLIRSDPHEVKRAANIFIFISGALARHAKWTALECVLNANLMAKSAPVGLRRYPGSLRTA